MKYPEHDKLLLVRDRSQAIGEFLDFSRYTLCEWHDERRASSLERTEYEPEGYYPVRGGIAHILADYFDIDEDKIESEKREMVEALRHAGDRLPDPPTRVALYTRMTLGGREAARDARRRAQGRVSDGESAGRRALR